MSELIDRPMTSFSNAEVVRDLETDHDAPPDRENYAAQAHDIFNMITRLRESGPLEQAYRQTEVEYVDKEPNPYLKELSATLLRAPYMVRYQRRHDELMLRHHQDRASLSHDDGQVLKQLIYGLCEYNHEVRDLVVSSQGNIAHDDLRNWLERASLGSSKWARDLMAGVSLEIAAYDACLDVPGADYVRFATVEEDLHGSDLRLGIRGRELGLDIKSGGQRRSDDIIAVGDHLEVPLERYDLEGFRLNAVARRVLVHDLASAVTHARVA